MKGKSKIIFQWLSDENAFSVEDNVYYAERAFFANSVVLWLKKQQEANSLNDGQLDRYMKLLRFFLQKKLDLFWDNGMINVQAAESKLKGGQLDDSSGSVASTNKRRK